MEVRSAWSVLFRCVLATVCCTIILTGIAGNAPATLAQGGWPPSEPAPGSEEPNGNPPPSSGTVWVSPPVMYSAPLDAPAADATDAAVPGHWYAVAGSVFLPANSGYSYQYGNTGCLKSNTAGYWRAPINLPDGVVLKYLSFSYKNDMYSNNSTAYVTKYQTNGDYADLVAVNSRNYTTTGGMGHFTDVSAEITSTVDNLNYAYTFIWSGSTTQRLCSLRIAYIPASIFGVALPLVLRQ